VNYTGYSTVHQVYNPVPNDHYAPTIRGEATSLQGAVEGFGGRGGFGRRPALIVVDMTLGFTDPESPLGSELDSPIEVIRKLLRAERRAEIPVTFTTVAYRESDNTTTAAFLDKVPALLTLEAGSRWAEIAPRIAPREAPIGVLDELPQVGEFVYIIGLPEIQKLKERFADEEVRISP
jgi:Isochorismatase family